MILNKQTSSEVPFMTEAVCLGNTPVQKIYLGYKLLYNSASVTTPAVDKYMASPFEVGTPSEINKFAPYTAGKIMSLPSSIVVDDNGTSRTCVLDPDCSVIGFAFKQENEPYHVWGLVHVRDGYMLLNEVPDTPAPLCLVCELKLKNGLWVYTPIKNGNFNPSGDHPYRTYIPGSRHLNIKEGSTVITSYTNPVYNLSQSYTKATSTSANGFDADTKSLMPFRIKDFCDKVLSGTVTLPSEDGSISNTSKTSAPGGSYKVFIHYEKYTADTNTYTFVNSSGTKVFDALLCDCTWGKDFDENPTLEEGSNPKIIAGAVDYLKVNGTRVNYPLIDFRGSSSNDCLSFIYNLIPGTTYTCVFKDASKVSKTFTMEGNMRLITLPCRNKMVTSGLLVYNVRDIGGTYATETGGTVHINYGRVYRGSDLVDSNDATYKMCNADIRSYLRDANKLNIYTEVRLNDPWKHGTEYVYPMSLRVTDSDLPTSTGAPSETPLHEMYVPGTIAAFRIFNPGTETLISSGSKGRVAFALNSIATALSEGKNVYYHCVAGADRTGMFTTLILGLCGVEEKLLYKQFELTNFSGKGYTRSYYTPYNNADECPFNYVKYIKDHYTGATLAAKIENFIVNFYGTDTEKQLALQTSINRIKAALIAN